MANRNFHQFKGSLDRGVVMLEGKILIAAGGAVSSETIVGASVTKTGTGQYKIILEDAYVEEKFTGLQLLSVTDVNMQVQVKSVDVVTAKEIVFKTLVGAVATDPVAACEIRVLLVLKNSSVY